jgi:uncharacterized protein (TIGR03000 family)
MGVPAIQGTPIVPATPEVKPEVKPDAPAPKTGSSAAPAKILVNLPADAKLFVDDFATKSTSDNRSFVTPELAPAKAFSYTLKAEIVRDGKTLTASEKVEVKAGDEINISLPVEKFAAATVAAK